MNQAVHDYFAGLQERIVSALEVVDPCRAGAGSVEARGGRLTVSPVELGVAQVLVCAASHPAMHEEVEARSRRQGELLRFARELSSRLGAVVVARASVPDDARATRAALEDALGSADVVCVSGGVSVGPHDHVKPAFEACGVEEVLWRVQIKPGKPLWFGRRGDTLVFGLPGNPLSTIVCFCVFIEPALRRGGWREPGPPAPRAARPSQAGHLGLEGLAGQEDLVGHGDGLGFARIDHG